jgi:hypothetical protein
VAACGEASVDSFHLTSTVKRMVDFATLGITWQPLSSPGMPARETKALIGNDRHQHAIYRETKALVGNDWRWLAMTVAPFSVKRIRLLGRGRWGQAARGNRLLNTEHGTLVLPTYRNLTHRGKTC